MKLRWWHELRLCGWMSTRSILLRVVPRHRLLVHRRRVGDHHVGGPKVVQVHLGIVQLLLVRWRRSHRLLVPVVVRKRCLAIYRKLLLVHIVLRLTLHLERWRRVVTLHKGPRSCSFVGQLRIVFE